MQNIKNPILETLQDTILWSTKVLFKRFKNNTKLKKNNARLRNNTKLKKNNTKLKKIHQVEKK